MKNKKIIWTFCILTGMYNVQLLRAQNNIVEREWTSFQQTIEVETKKARKFELSADIKPMGTAENSAGALWITSIDKNGNTRIFESSISNDSLANQWNNYLIAGTINENDTKIDFGGTVLNNGKFYFDNFQLYIENDSNEMEKIELQNPSFEEIVADFDLSGWELEKDKDGNTIKIKGFKYMNSSEYTDGSSALLIEGKEIQRDSSTIIRPEKGYTPQIGTLVAMLNNLSKRVEQEVEGLDQRELDFLLDENANSIGALIMHLAAAETYYQVYTFENREFTEEEKVKWQAALKLDENGRLQIKNHDITYYLKLYKKVREKTLSELKKRDDEWLAKTPKGGIMNNYFSWFHVMEHQSGHLGQIRMLKKRIPEELTIEMPNLGLD